LQRSFTFYQTDKDFEKNKTRNIKRREKETNLEINHNDDKISKKYSLKKNNVLPKMLDENRL